MNGGNIMLKRIVLPLIVVAVAAIVMAGGPQGESRTHYVVVDKNHTSLYSATVISDNGVDVRNESYLLKDVSGVKVRIDSRADYTSGKVTAEYRVNDGRSVRVTFQLPGRAATRNERIKEFKGHPELRNQDVPITVESTGKSLKTSEQEWKTGGTVKEKNKALVGADFAATMSSFRSMIGFPPLSGACSTFEFVSGGQACAMSMDLRIAEDRPDCAFDAAFGAPCSADQKLRAKNQGVSTKVGAY
jgi:hypothetical protein